MQRSRLPKLVAGRILAAERSEITFFCAIFGLAMLVGIVRPGNGIGIHILLVLWSALVGMMIPRILDARRPKSEPEPATDRPVMNHDIASALLMIEGGVTAMRYMHNHDESDQLEHIAHAIETEIRRIRRLSSATLAGTPYASIHDTIMPLIDLHVANGASIESQVKAAPLVAIAADDLARVFANLFDNCARHAPGAKVTVDGYKLDNDYVISIRDDGPGMSADIVKRASDAGVSTRPGGGLGLYSVRSMVEAAHGSIQIGSSDQGTLILLSLRLAEPCQVDIDLTDHNVDWPQAV